jgi:FkbM family methyltransferase
MSYLKGRFKKFFRMITGFELVRIGMRSVGFIHKSDAEDAWFLYHTQLEELFRNFKIDLVIDVGASYGDFAASLRSFYTGDIISFEPVSSVFKELNRRAFHDSRWRTYNCAVGNENSEREINVSDHTVFSSFLETNQFCLHEFGETSTSSRKEKASVYSLDEFLNKNLPEANQRKIFLKIDTQGYDLEVVQGLGNIMKNIFILQSELSVISIYKGMPHWIESLALLEKLGFEVVGLFPVNRNSLRVIEYDCLMTKNCI